MRRKAKRDTAEKGIVKALRGVGASVDFINAENIPDLIVGFRGVNYLIEVKTGKAKLKQGQADWHDEWIGQCAVARTPNEALRIIGAID